MVIKAREAHAIGLLPENILTVDFENPDFDNEEKEKLYYKNAIENYCRKIEEGNKDHETRANNYTTFFGLTLIMFFVIAVITLATIINHPS